MNDGRPVALVTGGAKRVGRVIAQRLAEAGFRLAFTYRTSKADADSLATATGALAIQADLFDPETACRTIADAIIAKFGRLDVLVNNASFFPRSSLSQTTIQLMRQLWAIHVESPLLLCQKFEQYLRRAHGAVINIVDASIEKPAPAYAAYGASKAALANLTLSLARELAPQVRVNGIAPGIVLWPDDFPDSTREKLLAKVPLGIPGSPQDVAELVKFLVTDGRYITGQIIKLDGGASVA